MRQAGHDNLVLRTHAELDLTRQADTEAFFAQEKPDYVFLAAAKVGGILANNIYPGEFIRDNLAIQANIIHAAYLNQVQRLDQERRERDVVRRERRKALMEEIRQRTAKLPVLDPRSDDEILGYNEFGTFD